MNDIKFNIFEHWLPVNEKRGTIDKDTLRIKVSGINFHTQQEASSWGIFTGYIKPDTNNTYDPNAIGFYKSDGTLLGYVQKELQDYVGKFTKGRELDCVIAITPFFSKEGKIRNQAYATILKFFEDDIEYATETINRVTEEVGHDALIEISHFENELSSHGNIQSNDDVIDDNKDWGNTVFRYDDYYKFKQCDKTGKKSYDTLTVKIENADWYFDRKKWQAGVFSGYVDVVHIESLNQYGIYRDDNTLVGCPDSFEFDDEIKEFTEGHRIFCIFMLVPHIDTKTSCIDIKGKAVLIKFFEDEREYAYKLFEDVRTRLANNAVVDYKKFTTKKAELEDCGISVLLSWSFDTRRYKFGDQETTYLDDSGKPQKSHSGCSALVAIFATVSILVIVFTMLII